MENYFRDEEGNLHILTEGAALPGLKLTSLTKKEFKRLLKERTGKEDVHELEDEAALTQAYEKRVAALRTKLTGMGFSAEEISLLINR